eukprot:CAMPEP_0194686168 /NCGR_PEP_ID=MMETSP0295-20121207/15313_1 /TAXON_ID=39354 /ORGANISM="Heterosigma akashiwo, Strain CCMP2393" /LENGTH=90 /DNA_ID=CAMNT_0039573883 /DNA_START=526 /DNA_END=795 /DNA_ORIENTATION=+
MRTPSLPHHPDVALCHLPGPRHPASSLTARGGGRASCPWRLAGRRRRRRRGPTAAAAAAAEEARAAAAAQLAPAAAPGLAAGRDRGDGGP